VLYTTSFVIINIIIISKKKLQFGIDKKIKQFKERGINILSEDIEHFLFNVLFKDKEWNKEEFNKFIESDNLELIVSYLMKRAIAETNYEWI